MLHARHRSGSARSRSPCLVLPNWDNDFVALCCTQRTTTEFERCSRVSEKVAERNLWPQVSLAEKGRVMKRKDELQLLMDEIACEDSPVGMDAVYVHALILDQLQSINERLECLEQAAESLDSSD